MPDENLKAKIQRLKLVDEADKPSNEPDVSLTLFLIFLAIINGLALLFYCSRFFQLGERAIRDDTLGQIFRTQLLMGFGSLIEIGALICVMGLWNWKKWGYHGLISLYVIGAILNLLTKNLLPMVGALVIAAILYYLVNDRIEMFE